MGFLGRAAENGRERGGRRAGVVLGEPQRGHSGADAWTFAFLFRRLGQGGIGLCGLPQPHEDVQEERAQLRREWVRGDGQASGGTQGG
jgi:hypothetical protein